MPLVRINLSKDYSPEQRWTVSEVVYAAMTEVANVPKHDKFQIFTSHSDGELVYPQAGYLGISYTQNIIFIQVFWVAGGTTDVKRAFYRRIADDLHAKAGVRKEDVWISLIAAAREDWSFGNGDMQYAPRSVDWDLQGLECTPPARRFCKRCRTPLFYERARTPHMVNIPRALFAGRTGHQPLYHIGIQELQEWTYAGEPLVPLNGFPGVVWERSKKKKKRVDGEPF